MRSLTASIVIGPLMLIGALPASAGQSTRSDAPIQLAASSDPASDRDTYTREAKHEMEEWQRKLHDFSANAEAKGKAADHATERDLNKIWTRTEAASRQLQIVGDKGWESAKISYENASHDLAEAWHKVSPKDE
jgi:TPR repeat protein